ncbi:MAG: F0F1 ATP synthase subunit A [Eubacterium sp.]|nr:F0F1 ATP synthase subunit A [Eubacterium sp.]
MSKKKRIKTIVIMLCVVIVLAVLSIVIGSDGKEETIKETMKDAVLHDENKISLFGLIDVNPSLISAYVVTAIILFIALLIRIFAIPKFKYVPGKFQTLIEEWVGLFSGMAKSNSPHRNRFLGIYIFTAGSYIFIGTCFELFGVQAVTTEGMSMALPAPLADINAAIAMGFMSYFAIMSGGIAENKGKGVLKTLKDFSLPISMSFRLFGALLSGLLVTEMVYYYTALSFVLPVIVGILFTLIHALIQAYVLTMLTALFYGEVSEPAEEKHKAPKKSSPKIS